MTTTHVYCFKLTGDERGPGDSGQRCGPSGLACSASQFIVDPISRPTLTSPAHSITLESTLAEGHPEDGAQAWARHGPSRYPARGLRLPERNPPNLTWKFRLYRQCNTQVMTVSMGPIFTAVPSTGGGLRGKILCRISLR